MSKRASANQENARRSTGPKDSSLSRYNATKHGLLAQGITELDSPENYTAFCSMLHIGLKPEGEVECFLVQRIGLAMLRLKRAAALEAEFLTEQLNPTTTYIDDLLAANLHVSKKGQGARVSADTVDALASKFGRYETQAENRLFRHLHELQRLQAMRRGEVVAAPASLEVAVHTDTQPLASFGNLPQPQQEGEP